MTHAHIACRLAVVGKSQKELHAAVVERMERKGLVKPGEAPIAYESLSRAMNGATQPKLKKAVEQADIITMEWLTQYATDTARSLAPRLKSKGLPTKDLDGVAVPTADFSVVITIRSAGVPIATFRPAKNQIGEIKK